MTDGEYNSCVEQYADAVFRFLIKQLGNKADADDLVQTTFEKVWIHREKVNFQTAKSYLFKVAYNSMIDWIRKNKRVNSVPEIKETLRVTETKSNFDLKEIIDQALSTLSEIQQSVLMLRDYEGYAYNEIATQTGLTESQVKVYIFRARKKMKNYLGQLENII